MTDFVEIGDQIESSYVSYSLQVIQNRAIPDLFDGLKPVQRRILYAMWLLGLDSKSSHKKCARILGDVLGKFHSHGEVSIYEALTRLAQDFSVRYPLIDGQGNFGTEEYPAAAHRYTEAKLARLSDLMLESVNENTVEFVDNFDGTTTEPVVLPTPFPTLLLNGASGIAVGLATNIPSHSFTPVCNTILAHLIDEEQSSEELLTYLGGPDFPKGGLVETSSLHEIYTTGIGSIRVKVRAHAEKKKNDSYRYIVITELGVLDKIKTLEKMARVVMEKKLNFIKDLIDQSRGDDTRIVIQLKQTELPTDQAWKKIVKTCGLIGNHKVNMIALLDNFPAQLNLRVIVKYWCDKRIEIVSRMFTSRLDKLMKEIETVNTNLKVCADKKKILKLVMESDTNEQIVEGLLKLGFLDRQVEQVLNTPIRALSRLNHSKLTEKSQAQAKTRVEYESILQDRELIKQYIMEEVTELKKKNGDGNKSTLVDSDTFNDYQLKVVKV